MQPLAGKATVTGLGPRLTVPMPAPTGTAPLTGTGILNLAALSTTAIKVLSAGGGRGLVRKCRLTCMSAANVAYTAVARGDTAPTITALGLGAATEGILLPIGGGIIETFDVADNLDLYVVASAAATVIQFAVVEQ